MTSKIEFRNLTTAKFNKEGYVDIGELSGGTCLCEVAFIAILAPVDGNAAARDCGSKEGEDRSFVFNY